MSLSDKQRRAMFAKGSAGSKSAPRPASKVAKSAPKKLKAVYPGEYGDYEHLEPGVEEHMALDLHLTADNDGKFNREVGTPIEENLRKKIRNGTYDPDKAWKAWQHWADRAAQDYTKDFHTPRTNGSYGLFDAKTRRAVAKKKAAEWFYEQSNEMSEFVE